MMVAIATVVSRPVCAEQTWNLSLGLQAPAFNRAGHASENTPQVVWNGWVKPGLGKLKVTTAGQYSTRDENPFWSESKANVGVEYPLSSHLSVYSFAEDRFRVEQWRYIAGVRFSIGG